MESNSDHTQPSPSGYTKTAGIMLLISVGAGVFGEIGVTSSMLVPGDADATAAAIQNSLWLYRLGFASYLLEAICDVSLALIFYQLLKPVRKDVSLLAAFFALMATATFAFAELFYFLVVPLLSGGYLSSFTLAQLNELAVFFIKVYGVGGGIFMLFYGIASILRGYLIFHSGYLPRFLGVLLLLAGSCFVLRNFLLVLAPSYVTDILLLPMLLTMLTMAIWFLVKGVDMEKWHQAQK